MFFVHLIFCAIFISISTSINMHPPKASQGRPIDDFDFSSEDINSTNLPINSIISNTKTATNPNKRVPNSRDTQPEPLSNLLKEVGTTLPQKLYRKKYNESKSVRICFKIVTYVRENNFLKGDRFPWREYEVIFDFPDAGDSRNIDNSNSEIRAYKVRDPEHGSVELLNFTVIERNANFTISKNEKMSCGSGKFLTKTYYEWPRYDKKRIVVILGDHSMRPRDGEEELVGQNLQESDQFTGQKSDIKNKRVPIDDHIGFEDGSRRRNMYDQNNEVTNNVLKKIRQGNIINSEVHFGNLNISNMTSVSESEDFRNSTTKNLELYNLIMKHQERMNDKANAQENVNAKAAQNTSGDGFLDLTVAASAPSIYQDSLENYNTKNGPEDLFLVPEDNVHSGAYATSKGSTSAVDPCSPILTTLLSGNGILPGLCTLRKNEKVVLKGDITVSKKYLNKENSEVVQPLYTIRENTEIRAFGENAQ